MRLFLSYRREDSADVTGRLHDRLAAHFGRDAVFIDVDSVPFGVDFRDHLKRWIAACDVVLVVIGDDWLGRRLEDPADFVRLEVEAALARGIPVVPVLVGEATMPAAAALPQSMSALAYRNAAELRSGRDFHDHAVRLIQGIEQVVGPGAVGAAPPTSPRVEPVAEPEVFTLDALLQRRRPIPEPSIRLIALALFDAIERGAELDPRSISLGSPLAPEVAITPSQPALAYAAPESMDGLAGSPIYTLGQIVWELAMGQPAFTGNNTLVRAAKRRQGNLRIVDPPLAVDARLHELVYRATAFSVSSRPDRADARRLLEWDPAVQPRWPALTTPINLGFEGGTAGGVPYGWFDGLGYVAGNSAFYTSRIVPSDRGSCLRLSRDGAHGNEFGTLMQRCPGRHLSSRRVRLRGELRSDNAVGGAALWLRADGVPRKVGDTELNTNLFFDNMADRELIGTMPWTTMTIETELPAGVEWINFGVILSGNGVAFADDLALDVRTSTGDWLPLAWEALVS